MTQPDTKLMHQLLARLEIGKQLRLTPGNQPDSMTAMLTQPTTGQMPQKTPAQNPNMRLWE
jgi:hypothetical protein